MNIIHKVKKQKNNRKIISTQITAATIKEIQIKIKLTQYFSPFLFAKITCVMTYCVNESVEKPAYHEGWVHIHQEKQRIKP